MRILLNQFTHFLSSCLESKNKSLFNWLPHYDFVSCLFCGRVIFIDWFIFSTFLTFEEMKKIKKTKMNVITATEKYPVFHTYIHCSQFSFYSPSAGQCYFYRLRCCFDRQRFSPCYSFFFFFLFFYFLLWIFIHRVS